MPTKKITDHLLPGHYYHIYNRGNEKTRIFYTEANYKFFTERFRHYLEEWVETFAYCFIPNHFHLLIRVKNNNNPETAKMVSKQFRKFFISYAMAINHQQNRKGSLFQKPFRRNVINSNWQLKRTVYYIHANPVKHQLSNEFKHFKYSSYHQIINKQKGLANYKEVLEWFNGEDEFIEYHDYFFGK